MAITQLFFRKGNFIGNIELDVIIEESASASARVTTNPVEKGADINDHVIVDPMTFSMVGVVSDSKVNVLDNVGVALNPGTYTGGNRPSKDAWDELLELHANRLPITLEQNLRSYENVVLLSLSERQDKNTSRGLFFTASFQVLNLVGESAIDIQQFNDVDTADMSIPNIAGGLKQILL